MRLYKLLFALALALSLLGTSAAPAGNREQKSDSNISTRLSRIQDASSENREHDAEVTMRPLPEATRRTTDSSSQAPSRSSEHHEEEVETTMRPLASPRPSPIENSQQQPTVTINNDETASSVSPAAVAVASPTTEPQSSRAGSEALPRISVVTEAHGDHSPDSSNSDDDSTLEDASGRRRDIPDDDDQRSSVNHDGNKNNDDENSSENNDSNENESNVIEEAIQKGDSRF